MASALGKVTLDELAAFLRKYGTMWTIDFGSCGAFAELLPGSPISTDDLLDAIGAHNTNSEFAYVFDDSDPPFDIINKVGIDNAEMLDQRSLERFIVRTVRGADFLYLAPSVEDAANGFYITLLPVEQAEPAAPAAPTVIAAIEIENFKGISEPVRIELRPITLLFGQNSAGKSSVLHALIYAREIFERHNLDADQTLAAGACLDLGGFQTLVHDHNLQCEVSLAFELNLSQIDLPTEDYSRTEAISPAQTDLRVLDRISGDVESASIKVAVRWDRDSGSPYVARYAVSINAKPLASLRFSPDRQSAQLADLNPAHPILVSLFGSSEPNEPSPFLTELSGRTIDLHGQVDALPRWECCLDPNVADPSLERSFIESGIDEDVFICALSMMLVGPGQLLRDVLAGLHLIGAQRQVPHRNYLPPRLLDPSRWAVGLAGWDLLFARPTLLTQVSQLLADPSRLNLGYTLEVVDFREFESSNRLLTALQTNSIDDIEDLEGLFKKSQTRRRLLFRPIESPEVTLEPADLGVGVSQMVPVLAAALDDQPLGSATLRTQLVAVEHPELNLHPRLQAELADVFLEGALAESTKGRIFFIETHSEVFTLRLFRRVRESHRRNSDPPPGDGSGAGHGDGTGDGRGDGSGASGLDLTVKPTDVGVWYVDRTTGVVSVKRIAVDVEGELIQPWPETDSLFEQDFRERYG